MLLAFESVIILKPLDRPVTFQQQHGPCPAWWMR